MSCKECEEAQDQAPAFYYRIESANGVHPTVDYPNAKRLLSRMAQLLDTGPFNPQLDPERIGIG